MIKTQTIDAKLLFAQNLIQNGTTVEQISTPMSAFGYDVAAMAAAKGLLDTAFDLQTKQKQEYGEQFAATDELTLARANANKAYMKHIKLARITLENDRGAYQSLLLSGNRKQSMSGWIQQSKTFYTNALASAAVKTALAKLTITEEVLNNGRQTILDVELKLNAQLKEKGEAQTATTARDQAFDELQEWVSQYVAVARIAMEDSAQLLEVLGIVEAS